MIWIIGLVAVVVVVLLLLVWAGLDREEAIEYEDPEPLFKPFEPTAEYMAFLEKQEQDIALRAERIDKARENGTSRAHAVLGTEDTVSEALLGEIYQAHVHLWNPIRFWRAPENHRKVVGDQYRLIKTAYETLCAERGWQRQPDFKE